MDLERLQAPSTFAFVVLTGRWARGQPVQIQLEVASLETIRRRLEAARIGNELRSELWAKRPVDDG